MLFPPWDLRELTHNFQVSDHLSFVQFRIVTPTCTTEQQTKAFAHWNLFNVLLIPDETIFSQMDNNFAIIIV